MKHTYLYYPKQNRHTLEVYSPTSKRNFQLKYSTYTIVEAPGYGLFLVRFRVIFIFSAKSLSKAKEMISLDMKERKAICIKPNDIYKNKKIQVQENKILKHLQKTKRPY